MCIFNIFISTDGCLLFKGFQWLSIKNSLCNILDKSRYKRYYCMMSILPILSSPWISRMLKWAGLFLLKQTYIHINRSHSLIVPLLSKVVLFLSSIGWSFLLWLKRISYILKIKTPLNILIQKKTILIYL